MKLKSVLFSIFFLLTFVKMQAQQWGYATLIAPQNSTTASLIDTNNTVIKTWTGLSGQTGYSSYLLEGGTLWRTVKATGGSFNGGGITGRVQKVSYNGTILFDYTISTSDECSHHDICPMPNGNVLLIVYELKTAAEVQAAGCTANATRWSEKIIELQPTGVNTADIVWEWYLWDHLVQNVDPAKPNYQSSIVNHPELLNVNYKNTATDWVHMNGIDYNSGLDQIVVTSHNLNELWVIDHSTSTAQAATHTGGNGGKGGDFLYRWGNPAAYSATGNTIFNVVHDGHWVPAGSPNAGYLGGFNNKGVSNTQSSIDLINPPLSGYNYTITPGQAYQPSTYTYRHSCNGYSSNMGNSQQLPNGNMLICLATAAKVYEIAPNGNQIWQYTGTGSIPQAWRHERCFIESPSVAVVTPNPTLCAGGSTQLDITPAASASGVFTYAWSPSTGLSSSTVQDPVVSNITSPITYTVTVSTAGGCTATATIPVSISPAPTANAGDDVIINLGESTTLSASGGGTYHWSNGANTANTTVMPTTTTTYFVTVTDPNGCTAVDDVVVNVTVANPLSVTAWADDLVFCLGNSTFLHAAAVGGTGNYSYSWTSVPLGFTSNQSDPEVTPVVNTLYKVTVSDGSSTATASVSITVNPLPNANAGNNVSIVLGQSTTLTATGGVSYEWSNGANTASTTVSPTTTTIYTVTVTNANDCTATDDVTVTVTLPPLTLTLTAANTAFCPGESTTLFANAGGGTGNYSFTWTSTPTGFSSTESEPEVFPTSTTTYHCVVHDGNSTQLANISITVYPEPNANAGNDITIVAGQPATLTATGGGSYVWSNGENTAVTVVSPSVTTAYEVTVTNSNGCTDTDQVTVNVTAPPLAISMNASNTAFCSGETAILYATATGGTGNYTYSWTSNPMGFTSNAADPAVNPTTTTTYTCAVSDGITSVSGNITLTVYPLPTANAGNDVSIILGQSATLNATGGVSYSWSNGANTSTTIVTPNVTTQFTVTATNSNGCTGTDAVTVIVHIPPTVSISASSTAFCLGNSTTLTATGSGGTGNYSYSWSSNPAGFTSNIQNPVVNPQTSTTYTVTVSDGIATGTASINIAVFPLPTADAGPDVSIIFGQSTTLNASGGAQYSWSNGANTETTTVSPQNTTAYTVTTTDANGCTDTDAVLVTVTGTALSMNITASSTLICSGTNATLQALVSGGSGNYTYTWASVPAGYTGSTAQVQVTPIENTTYLVTVSDGITAISGTIDLAVLPLPAANAGNDVMILPGQSTNLLATGGDIYLWSNGAATAGTTVSPLTTTLFAVTVTGNNGCSAVDDVLVTVTGTTLSLSASASSNTVCAGNSVQLNATATGGSGNYTYAWTSNPAGFTATSPNPSVTPLENTTFTVEVSDGITTTVATVGITVNALPPADAGVNQTIIIGQSATLFASGGTNYLWSTGANTTEIVVAPITTTLYFVTVSDANGCSAIDSVTVTVTGTYLSTSASATANTLCAGASSQLEALPTGGSGNYTYLWSSDPIGFTATTKTISVAPAQNTIYTVQVSDGITTISAQVSIVVNPAPAANAGTDVSIPYGQSTVLTATGGDSYLWNTGEATAAISVSPATTTTYFVTVTNAAGCTAIDAVTVTVTGGPLVVTVPFPVYAICQGSFTELTANASGGSGSYQYSWTSIPAGFASNLPNPVANPTENTQFTVEVTDGVSTVTATVTVEVMPLPVADAGADIAILPGGVATLTATGGVSYAWSNGDQTATIEVSPNVTTLYSVTVTSQNGCTNTDNVLVTVDPNVLVGAISATDTVICLGDVVQLFGTASGGTGNYTYFWTATDFTSTIADPYVNPTETTTYTLTISDGASSTVLSFTVVVNPQPAQPVITANDLVLTSSSPTGNQWFYYGSPIAGEVNQQFSPTVEGSYQVQTVDENGCFSQLSDPYEFILINNSEVDILSWKMVPNPASDEIRIIGSLTQMRFTVDIVNQIGQWVLSEREKTAISVGNLPAGTYFVRVQSGNYTGFQKLTIIR